MAQKIQNNSIKESIYTTDDYILNLYSNHQDQITLHFISRDKKDKKQFYTEMKHADLAKEIQYVYPSLHEFVQLFEDTEFYAVDMETGFLIIKTYLIAKNKKIQQRSMIPLQKNDKRDYGLDFIITKQQWENLLKKVSSLEAQNSKLKSEQRELIHEQSKTRAAYSQQIAQRENKIASDLLCQFETIVNNFEKKFSNSDTSFSNLEFQVSQLEKKYMQLEGRYTEFEKKCFELERKESELSSQLDNHKNTVQRQKAEQKIDISGKFETWQKRMIDEQNTLREVIASLQEMRQKEKKIMENEQLMKKLMERQQGFIQELYEERRKRQEQQKKEEDEKLRAEKEKEEQKLREQQKLKEEQNQKAVQKEKLRYKEKIEEKAQRKDKQTQKREEKQNPKIINDEQSKGNNQTNERDSSIQNPVVSEQKKEENTCQNHQAIQFKLQKRPRKEVDPKYQSFFKTQKPKYNNANQKNRNNHNFKKPTSETPLKEKDQEKKSVIIEQPTNEAKKSPNENSLNKNESIEVKEKSKAVKQDKKKVDWNDQSSSSSMSDSSQSSDTKQVLKILHQTKEEDKKFVEKFEQKKKSIQKALDSISILEIIVDQNQNSSLVLEKNNEYIKCFDFEGEIVKFHNFKKNGEWVQLMFDEPITKEGGTYYFKIVKSSCNKIAFGITDRKQNIKRKSSQRVHKSVFTYEGKTGAIKGSFGIYKAYHFSQEDIIAIEVNPNKGHIKFFKNGELMAESILKEIKDTRRDFVPFLQMCHCGDQAQFSLKPMVRQ